MIIEHQFHPEFSRLATLIKPISVAMMTNLNTSGELVCRPMWPLVMDKQGNIWFFTQTGLALLDSLTAVNLSFAEPTRATFVSVAGHGEVVNDTTMMKSLWTPAAKTWFAEGPDSRSLSLLKFVPSGADYWNSAHCKLVKILKTSATGRNNGNQGLVKNSKELTLESSVERQKAV